MEISNFTISCAFEEKPKFKTSLNIIGEVMNVPMCALSSILRANGYEEVPSASICIDEEMLTYFADAYIRKMKNYFLSSVRNIENLTYQEFTDLNEFYNTFKKRDVKYVRKAEWSHIDTGRIRDAFMDKIRELAPRKKSYFDLLFERIVETCDYVMPCCVIEQHYGYKSRVIDVLAEPDVLTRIAKRGYYIDRPKVKKTYSICSVNILRRILVAARYHIFVADDVDSCDYVYSLKSNALLYNHLKNHNKYGERTAYKKYRSEQSFRRRQVQAQKAC